MARFVQRLVCLSLFFTASQACFARMFDTEYKGWVQCEKMVNASVTELESVRDIKDKIFDAWNDKFGPGALAARKREVSPTLTAKVHALSTQLLAAKKNTMMESYDVTLLSNLSDLYDMYTDVHQLTGRDLRKRIEKVSRLVHLWEMRRTLETLAFESTYQKLVTDCWAPANEAERNRLVPGNNITTTPPPTTTTSTKTTKTTKKPSRSSG